MIPAEFEERLDQAVRTMNRMAKAGMPGYSNSDDFEKTVLAQLRVTCADRADAKPSFHDTAFPDIVVNGFGVEVKFTKRSTWHGTGNSIFEGMRDKAADRVYLVYYRADIFEARWNRYEDCIKGVRISHSPRYMIDMDGGGRFFRDLDMTLEEFKNLETKRKMVLVKEDVRKRLKKGGRPWWSGGDHDHTLPVDVRLYGNLAKDGRAALQHGVCLHRRHAATAPGDRIGKERPFHWPRRELGTGRGA